MGTINLSHIYFTYLQNTEAGTLAKFARADGCFRIYKFAAWPDGPQDNALPIREQRDEAAMYGSQHVYNPEIIYPLNERTAPLHTNLQVVELEGDTIEEARKKIPAGFEIIVERVFSEGGLHSSIGCGDSRDQALDKVKQSIPRDATTIRNEVIADYTVYSISVDSVDEAGALAFGRDFVKEKTLREPVIKARLISEGKKGFLGIGSKPNHYEVEITQPTIVERFYAQKAKLKAVIGIPDNNS